MKDNPAFRTAGRGKNAIRLDGRLVAKGMRAESASAVSQLRARYGLLPGLAVLRVGDDAASVSYSDWITRVFLEAGLDASVLALPSDTSRAMLQAELGRASVLPEIAAIMMQMPLPGHIGVEAVIDVLDPAKDVDGIHPLNIGALTLGLDSFVPATPAGGVALLDAYGIPVAGKHVVIVGRSGIVGKPLAQLLLSRNATVTVAHSWTRDLDSIVRSADIVASATGQPSLINGSMLKPGAVVLDFGTTVRGNTIVGDVDFDSAIEVASAITPVPGGTGPMTNAMLLRNTIRAIKRSLNVR